jgi:dTDP-4-amino-4,6-dideoxyglucose
MKSLWRDLAIAGGAPEFDRPMIVGRPNTGDIDRFFARMGDVFASGRFSNNGPFAREFEARICELTGARHCIATCNATIGLELAITALGLTGSVVVPSFTFVATAHALQRCGITPLFCDVDSATHNISAAAAEQAIRPDTSGILGVHLWGRACPIDELEALARKRGLRLLFDAAHAFGCTHNGRPVGTFGRAEVFSFHATKAINSFEGGAIVTHDDQLAAKLRELRMFGQDNDGTVVRAGTNAKMSEPCAAMGLTSLDAMDAIFAHNRSNYDVYRATLDLVPGLRFAAADPGEVSNYQFVPLEVDAGTFGMSRDQLLHVLGMENVVAKAYFSPGCHACEPYRSRAGFSPQDLPVTDRLGESVLCLPTGLAVSPEDAARIARIIALSASPEPGLTARLPSADDRR